MKAVRAAGTGPWRFARLTSAPSRPGFFAAAVAQPLPAPWRAVALAACQAGVVLPWGVSPPVAHGLCLLSTRR